LGEEVWVNDGEKVPPGGREGLLELEGSDVDGVPIEGALEVPAEGAPGLPTEGAPGVPTEGSPGLPTEGAPGVPPIVGNAGVLGTPIAGPLGLPTEGVPGTTAPIEGAEGALGKPSS